jgi:hypothetical protein
MRAYSHDAFVFLDGGWRVLNGQKPHIDFFSDIGPLVHVVSAVGLLLARGRAEGLGYAQAVVGCALGLWAWFLSDRRLGQMPRALFCLSAVFLAVSPYTPGDAAMRVSPAVVYNRYGYVWIALVMLEASCERIDCDSRRNFTGGLSTGAIAALLLFLKISYFPGALFLLAALWPCRRQTAARWVGIGAGFVAALIPFLAFLNWTLLPMLADLRILAGAKHISWHWSMADAVYHELAPLLIFVLMAAGLLWVDGATHEARSVFFAGAATALAGVLFLVSNFQGNRLPLNAFAAILIVQIVDSRFAASCRRALLRCSVLAWAALFILGSIGLDAAGLGFGLAGRVLPSQFPRQPFHAARLAEFWSSETDCVSFVNDGIDLVQRNRRPGDSLTSLDFSNPFSYSLGMKPVKGGMVDLQYRTNFDDFHAPSPERLMAGATLVMVPRAFSDGTLTMSVPRIFGPYLESHFHRIGESQQWRLYRQNQR